MTWMSRALAAGLCLAAGTAISGAAMADDVVYYYDDPPSLTYSYTTAPRTYYYSDPVIVTPAPRVYYYNAPVYTAPAPTTYYYAPPTRTCAAGPLATDADRHLRAVVRRLEFLQRRQRRRLQRLSLHQLLTARTHGIIGRAVPLRGRPFSLRARPSARDGTLNRGCRRSWRIGRS
jgi:hypothetical protein